MTNEEMMRQFLAGDVDIIADVYSNIEAFIKSIAVQVSSRCNCSDADTIEELCSHGKLSFFLTLNKMEYDESKGKLTTYLKPHIEGELLHFMKRFIKYKAAVTSVYDLGKEDEDGDQQGFYDYYEDARISPPHVVVYRKICIELLEELFNALTRKEKIIVVNSFGVYGYSKTSLEDIAFEQVMKVDGVIKARDKAIKKICQDYKGSNLQIWQHVWRTVNKMAKF